jgi:hypothetical protein
LQGDVEFNAISGLSLKSSWGIARDFVVIIWTFLSGGWINNIIAFWNLGLVGTWLGRKLQVLYVVGLIFGLLYALFKIQL